MRYNTPVLHNSQEELKSPERLELFHLKVLMRLLSNTNTETNSPISNQESWRKGFLSGIVTTLSITGLLIAIFSSNGSFAFNNVTGSKSPPVNYPPAITVNTDVTVTNDHQQNNRQQGESSTCVQRKQFDK
jgi:hypothetical protein